MKRCRPGGRGLNKDPVALFFLLLQEIPCSPPPTATAPRLAHPLGRAHVTTGAQGTVPVTPLIPPGAVQAEKARRPVTHLVDIFLGRAFLMAVGLRVGITEPHLRVAEKHLKHTGMPPPQH